MLLIPQSLHNELGYLEEKAHICYKVFTISIWLLWRGWSTTDPVQNWHELPLLEPEVQ